MDFVEGVVGDVGSVRMGGPDRAVSISRVENGYSVSFVIFRKTRVAEPPKPPSVESQNEAIDDMLEGIKAVIRSINDHGAGETWKEGGEDQEKVRRGFRALFPRMMPSMGGFVPEVHNYVFPSLEQVLAFLKVKMGEE